MMNKLFLTLFNCFLYYVGWYGAVILAAYHYPLLAPSILIPIIIWEVAISRAPLKRFIVVLIMIVGGFFIETTLMSTNIVSYASPLSILRGGAPLWVMGLWGMIGATLDDVFQWFEGKNPMFMFFLGLIGGCLGYYAGSVVGAVSFPREIWISLPLLGMVWGIVLLLLYKGRTIL